MIPPASNNSSDQQYHNFNGEKIHLVLRSRRCSTRPRFGRSTLPRKLPVAKRCRMQVSVRSTAGRVAMVYDKCVRAS